MSSRQAFNKQFKRVFKPYIIVFTVVKNWRARNIGDMPGSSPASDTVIFLTFCLASNAGMGLQWCYPGGFLSALEEHGLMCVAFVLLLLIFNGIVAEVRGSLTIPPGRPGSLLRIGVGLYVLASVGLWFCF